MPKHGKTFANPFAEMECFSVETCLRFVALSRKLPTKFLMGTEVYQGADAYRFMLEIACGLHSKIQGESEIFGQIKKAWKSYHEAEPVASKPLNTMMQHLFADTKRVRTEYLHGIGGHSYSSATQKLLNLKKDQSVLIIGAGQFGAMFATKLISVAKNVVLINRSPKPHPLVETIVGWDELEEEMSVATHVLVCIPAGQDLKLDARIQAAWRKHEAGKMIHFGQMQFAETAWQDLPNFLSLADVMALQNTQGEAKPQRIAQALAAINVLTEERMNGISIKNRILEAV